MGQKTVGRKGNRNKKSEDNLKDVGEHKDAIHTRVRDGVRLSNEDKKQKNKKKHEVGSDDVQFIATQNEDVNLEGFVDVEGNEMEKDQRKKRKSELNKDEKEFQKARKKDKRIRNDGEVSEVKEASKETHMGEEENMNLQTKEWKDLGNDSELKAKKEKKKKHKEIKNKDGMDTVSSLIEISEDNRTDDVVKEQRCSERKDVAEVTNGEENKKKKKKRKKETEGGDVEVKNSMIDREEVGKEREQWDGKITDMGEYAKKKGKREKKNRHDGLGARPQEIVDEKLGNESSRIEDKEFGDNEGDAHSTENKKGGGKKDRKKKKAKSGKKVSEGKGRKGVPRTKTKVENTDLSENPTHKETSKRVSFSDHVEVFPSYDGPSDGKIHEEEDLVRGKRFSLEEDEKIKEAVYNYIEARRLGEEGLNMVLHCKSHREVKNCWKEIGAALPWRPCESVYYRAHILFERAEKRTWTAEEYELVRKFYEKHGSNWRALGEALGKHRFHVKDTYRRIKLPNVKKGRWSQEEYQTLFDLVNMDLRMKAFEEKISKHGMLRDNICWGAISDKLSTRTNAICCMKWYDQLTSPMVAEGKWADADDYRLLNVLYSLDACSMEEVDWDYLLEHRSGDVCRKRWNQMVKHIGECTNKPFAEQVEILSKRYCPDVLEAREAYDSSTTVP